MKKYSLVLILALGLFADNQKMQIYKPVSSSCPQSWLDEMQQNIQDVKVVSLIDMKALKHEVGVPKDIQSCNTSVIDDYIFEGNVPSSAIKDFFKDIPKNAIGLSLPSYENDKELKTVFIIFEDKTYKEFGKYH
jgi:hypothetical protein